METGEKKAQERNEQLKYVWNSVGDDYILSRTVKMRV